MGIIWMVKNKEKDVTNGLMGVSMKENGMIIRLTVMVFIIGLMVEDMKDIGRITICMEKEFIHGKMEENMKVNI